MRNELKGLFILGLLCLIGISARSEDKFKLIKNKISLAATVHLDVLITTESRIFNVIDSVFGQILLADDGRYLAEFSGDIYLNDGKNNWEYSAENNQATRQEIREGEIADNRLAFFKNIDSFYSTSIVKEGLRYKLIKLDSTNEALPDSMTVILEKNRLQISKIEYYDLNDDLNCIYITGESYEDRIRNNLFKLDLPDSVEIISLP